MFTAHWLSDFTVKVEAVTGWAGVGGACAPNHTRGNGATGIFESTFDSQ